MDEQERDLSAEKLSSKTFHFTATHTAHSFLYKEPTDVHCAA